MGIRKTRVARNIVTVGLRQLRIIYWKRKATRALVVDEAVHAKQSRFCSELALFRASRDAALSSRDPS